jgi:hypothetical protein
MCSLHLMLLVFFHVCAFVDEISKPLICWTRAYWRNLTSLKHDGVDGAGVYIYIGNSPKICFTVSNICYIISSLFQWPSRAPTSNVSRAKLVSPIWGTGVPAVKLVPIPPPVPIAIRAPSPPCCAARTMLPTRLGAKWKRTSANSA